jgi:hypothetical protein
MLHYWLPKRPQSSFQAGMAEQNELGIVSTAITIAKERSRLLNRIRTLLEKGDDGEAVKLMRQYCGINDEQKSNRVN